jgi:hypothetical protein
MCCVLSNYLKGQWSKNILYFFVFVFCTLESCYFNKNKTKSQGLKISQDYPFKVLLYSLVSCGCIFSPAAKSFGSPMKRKILVATQNGSYKLPPSNRKKGGRILTFYLQLFMNFYVFIIIKISVFPHCFF